MPTTPERSPSPAQQETGIKVTVEDLATGEVEEQVIRDNYLLITVGDRYVAHEQRYANGTTLLTVKRAAGRVVQGGDHAR